MAPTTLPSLAVDLPLDDAIDILKRRQVHYQSAPVLPPAESETPAPKEVKTDLRTEKELASTSSTWRSSSLSSRMPSRTKAIKALKSKNLFASLTHSAPRLPAAEPARPDFAQEPRVQKLPRLPRRRKGSHVGPLPPGWRPSSKGQTVSRAAAAAFWGMTLQDDGSEIRHEEDFSQHMYKHHKRKTTREFPLAALHAATSVPLSDLKEACAVFEQFANDCEDLSEATMAMNDFEALLCSVTNVSSVAELDSAFVKSAFYTADRDHGGYLDIWEFVKWYSAFSFSEAICVNKFARDTRDVARKHGMSILNIERYKKSFDRYDLNSNGVIEFSEFKNIISDLLKIPPGLDLPQERVLSMWRNADKDGNGSIDFEEFVAFYVKVFGDTFENEFDPVSDYYRSMRRMQ